MGRLNELTYYIAGPMTGYKDFNYLAFFEAEKMLKEQGFTNIVNPARINHPDLKWEKCIRRAIAAMMKADAVILLPGWSQSTGARIEAELASEVGMSVMTFDQVIKTAAHEGVI